jgi:hypothetical protein
MSGILAVESNVEEAIARRFELLKSYLDERRCRLWAAAEAESLGRGGQAAVARATGLSPATILVGQKELAAPSSRPSDAATMPIRKKGSGRPHAEDKQPGLVEALRQLIEPSRRGDPVSALSWTTKSTAKLAKDLGKRGFKVSERTVARLLHDDDFSLQSVRKRHEGKQHPDRDAQFLYIYEQTKVAVEAGLPVISVDTKAKQLVGNFVAKGREYQPKGRPIEVNAYDFPSWADGKAVPYGVYDMHANEGWVSVGQSKDTAQFAVNTIWTWWQVMGSTRYAASEHLFITADCGGSNSSRGHLWKKELQALADELGKKVTVLHYPPGTSKWNKIEHRMFSQISLSMRGRPSTSFEVLLNSIANTTTETGLRIEAALDLRSYECGIKISSEELQKLNIERHDFHGEWNYTISPRTTS